MKYRTRIFYTESQKAERWDRWQKGETLHQIAVPSHLFGVTPPDDCIYELRRVVSSSRVVRRAFSR